MCEKASTEVNWNWSGWPSCVLIISNSIRSVPLGMSVEALPIGTQATLSSKQFCTSQLHPLRIAHPQQHLHIAVFCRR